MGHLVLVVLLFLGVGLTIYGIHKDKTGVIVVALISLIFSLFAFYSLLYFKEIYDITRNPEEQIAFYEKQIAEEKVKENPNYEWIIECKDSIESINEALTLKDFSELWVAFKF